MSFIIDQGGSANNVQVVKGLCQYPNLYNSAASLVDQGFSNVRIRFQPNQAIQIYQDTVISEVRYQLLISSATDEWYIGLYRYDLPTDKFIKACQWDMTTLSVAGAVSQTLGSPITIGPGTYFIGVKSKDFTAEGVGISAYAASKPNIQWHTALTAITSTVGIVNGFQLIVDVAMTVLPDEILSSSMTYFRSSYPQFAPYLVY